MLLLLQWMLDRESGAPAQAAAVLCVVIHSLAPARRRSASATVRRTMSLAEGIVLNEGDGFSAHLVLSFVWCGPMTGVLLALCIGPMSSAIDLVSCVSSLLEILLYSRASGRGSAR